MSTKYPQGVITATPPFQSTTAQNFSGVWTLEQLGKNYFYYQQQIAKSLRFRASASAYLNRTPSSAGNRQTWTWSAWVKRGALGANRTMLGAGSASNQIFFLCFGSDDKLYIHNGVQATSTESWAVTSQVFRDPSAWYHIVLVMDTTNATATNRVKLYINGVQSTLNNNSANYYPSQNYATAINNTVSTTIGFGFDNASTSYTDGYMGEVNFIDGQALDPSYFGQLSTITGVWSPKKYVGSYGTNGFYLPFTNTTSTTTIGYDSSGNGNNWTTNNISLTSGSTYDSMWDSPTSYDDGNNGVGNYAVLNPLLNSGGTISNGNLSLTGPAVSLPRALSISVSSGLWYMEASISWDNSQMYTQFGIVQSSQIYSSGYLSQLSTSYGVTVTPSFANYATFQGSTVTQWGAKASSGTVLAQLAFDASSGKIWFGINGSWLGGGNPATGTSPTYSSVPSSNWFFCFSVGSDATNTAYVNCGQRPFAYTPPTGFKALNTQNLPAPSIANGANHMAATTYTGNGATQSIVNAYNSVSFQPDFVWIKQRNTARDNQLQDVIRGVGKELQSNTTGAETTYGLVSSFNSNGFSVYTNGTYLASNENGGTYVAWQWKAGGTAVTNTAGSITSSVSANTTAGFSVVTWTATGTGSTQTVGHGLGVTPSMVIVKSRTDGTTYNNWTVYHQSLASTYNVYLNLTLAAGTTPGFGWLGIPTSSAITLSAGTSGNNNVNSGNMVAYCFAAIPGYSAFGSYTGNGSTDGPFVYCGFRPRWILIKRTDSSSNADWRLFDTARNPYNTVTGVIFANLSDAENTASTWLDILSNGFKLKNSTTPNGGVNGNGESYIYACFAENPFKYSLAR